jgi:hypothetical protein
MELDAVQVEEIEQRWLPPIEREADLFNELRGGTADEAAVRAYVEQAYSEDVVFADATFGDSAEGYDEMTRMYRRATTV